MAGIPPYPLYHRSYALCRVSPLHTGDAPLLDERVLRTHAQRLASQLKGDNIRGVHIDGAGGQGTALASLGPLARCSWDVLGDEEDWINTHRQLVDPDASVLSTSQQARGVQVTLAYENHAYNALLLMDPATTTSPDSFTALPLLMLKMPAPLRAVFVNYLETAFDARVAPLRLPSTFLTSTLETYFRRLAAGSSIRDVIRQLQLQFVFPSSTTLLKHIDVTIAADDVAGFVQRGKRLPNSVNSPFTAAISSYLHKHLALDISNPKVQLAKISCNSFTLATDRLKLAVPDFSEASVIEDRDSPGPSPSQLALQDLYIALVREATGTGRFLSENAAIGRASGTPSSDGSPAPRGATRKRAASITAITNAKPKKSKPQGR